MKNCLYCFEEIRDEAIKCKHCGEFLEKKNRLNDLFSNLKRLLPKNENTELSFPTDDEPLGNSHIIFKSKTFIWNNTIFPYETITNIGFRASVNKSNFVTNRKIIFCLAVFANTNGQDLIYDINVLSPIYEPLELNIDKKSFEGYNIIHNYLCEKTFEIRLKNYIDLINSNGFFSYMGYSFYNNGDILNQYQKKVANLLYAYINNQIGFGTKFSNLKSSIQTIDPYEFVISNGNPKLKFLLFESGFTLKLQTISDQDVFYFLISYFIEHKKLPTNLKFLYESKFFNEEEVNEKPQLLGNSNKNILQNNYNSSEKRYNIYGRLFSIDDLLQEFERGNYPFNKETIIEVFGVRTTMQNIEEFELFKKYFPLQ